MEKIIFTCKTVTPLVMNGAYGDQPELRPPGIKASLRFWWRALHGHLSLDELRKQESAIFGNTKDRSKVLIRMEQNIDEPQKVRTPLLPHKQEDFKKSPALAFNVGLIFKIRIDCESKHKEMLKNLFILACTLGGWGKRSRRGFGSVAVTEVDEVAFAMPTDLNGILSKINFFEQNRFEIQNGIIKPKFPISKGWQEAYPYILEIKIGSSTKTLTQIGQVSHDVMSEREPQKLNYKYVLGAGTPRFASPIFVSLLPSGLPIVTTLRTVAPRITRKDEERGASNQPSLQTDFKDLILNP
ncbi:MAG: type III-B CRISPR module RAMP protein Cmr1 [Saprospiraceae bacterium]